MFFYNTKKVNTLLSSIPLIQGVLEADVIKNFFCPYDKLIICSDKPPTQQFLDLIRPARFTVKDSDSYYRYKLVSNLFCVHWGQMNPQASTTSIMLNPWKYRLTPEGVLELIDLIIGSHLNAYVVISDDKVDCFQFLNSEELSKRLYVRYQKKPPRDYEHRRQTYLYGKRKGQQVKNYDKAEEQGLNNEVWTRIEDTKKRRYKQSRLTLLQFIFDERADAMKKMTVLDIDKFSNRDMIMKRIHKYGTFQEAFMSLDDKEKRKLKKHEAFKNPVIDLSELFRADLNKWMSLSPSLYLTFKIMPILRLCWSGRDKHFYRIASINPVIVNYHTEGSMDYYSGKNKYEKCTHYFEME